MGLTSGMAMLIYLVMVFISGCNYENTFIYGYESSSKGINEFYFGNNFG